MEMPFVDAGDENWTDKLDIAIRATMGSSAWSNDRSRPYDGQPHTDSGERGKTLVVGLTVRDILDCYVMGTLDSCSPKWQERVESGSWRWTDLEGLEDQELNPMAVAQNMACHIEKMMGIYPNVGQSKS